MSPHKRVIDPPERVGLVLARICGQLGRQVHAERLRRRWTLRTLALRAFVAPSTLVGIEAGAPASVDA